MELKAITKQFHLIDNLSSEYCYIGFLLAIPQLQLQSFESVTVTIIITIIIIKIYLEIQGLCSSQNLKDPCFLNNINNSDSLKVVLYNSNLCVLIYLK